MNEVGNPRTAPAAWGYCATYVPATELACQHVWLMFCSNYCVPVVEEPL